VDLSGGCEWVVEAYGCSSDALRDLDKLQTLFALLIEDLRLHPIGVPQWHCFGGEAGITGLTMLSESHLACHTFPEFGTLCLNLFCCRPKPEWDFDTRLRELFGAQSVSVRCLERSYRPQAVGAAQS
jgi:S-adenosylmethionine decarboxylase